MTVRLYLPERMGTTVSVNPVTYEPVVKHPILNVYSSHCSIKMPVLEWLDDTYGDSTYTGFDGERGEYYIDFPTEADVTWFKLRWLS